MHARRALVAGLLFFLTHSAHAAEKFDVVVYGGTAGGAASAIQVSRMGKSVVLIEPGRHVGGMTSGGLGATDIGNKAAIGGIAREFYQNVYQHYSDPAAWKYETSAQYAERRRAPGEDTMWTFEPHVAEAILRRMLDEAKVPIHFGERLDLAKGVTAANKRITSIRMESGRTYEAAMFIDATYEGDLMAKAGVSYTVGRESNATYNETLNGVQIEHALKHQFIKPVDPYVVPGDPASGVLPGVHAGSPGKQGEGDHRVQAYNYRLCATDALANRRPWPQPADYQPLRYELLLRNFEAGDDRIPWNPVMMPNRKTDSNNNYAVSTDNIGMNYDYPDGDYATREKIIAEHISYTQGLLWTLANNPRVPEKIRQHFQTWGLAKDEFTDTDNWPHQLYVREARRMQSAYVMTEHNCRGSVTAEDPVGLAAYTMDSHNTQRYVSPQGKAINEGDVQVGGFSPYPISYRSIVPKAEECQNLFVPVCLSATHIAYGSIRMEPVFMVLGQSSATAACHAIDQQATVQQVDFPKLRERLMADKQIIEWTGPRRQFVDPKRLSGVVADKPTLTGEWSTSGTVGPYVGENYLHDGDTDKGAKSASFTAQLPKAGKYEVRFAYSASGNRATNVPVVVHHAGGETAVTVNQRETPKIDKLFASLGTFAFDAGSEAKVVVSNQDTDGYVVIDAVQWMPVE